MHSMTVWHEDVLQATLASLASMRVLSRDLPVGMLESSTPHWTPGHRPGRSRRSNPYFAVTSSRRRDMSVETESVELLKE